MENTDIKPAGWHIRKLIGFNVLILAIVLGFMGNDFKSPWDEAIFFTLNGSLQEGRDLWNGYWAITNSRLFDTFSAVLLGFVCLHYLLKNRTVAFAERLSRVFLLVLAVVIIMVFISQGFEHYYHQSPSQVLTPFIDINNLVNWLEVKTGTRKSFPSDHAAVSFVAVILSWRYFGRSYGLFLTVYALVNATPRMVGGGHWFGDVWIGGVLLALFVSVWLIYSPLLTYVRKAVGQFLQISLIQKLTSGLS